MDAIRWSVITLLVFVLLCVMVYILAHVAGAGWHRSRTDSLKAVVDHIEQRKDE